MRTSRSPADGSSSHRWTLYPRPSGPIWGLVVPLTGALRNRAHSPVAMLFARVSASHTAKSSAVCLAGGRCFHGHPNVHARFRRSSIGTALAAVRGTVRASYARCAPNQRVARRPRLPGARAPGRVARPLRAGSRSLGTERSTRSRLGGGAGSHGPRGGSRCPSIRRLQARFGLLRDTYRPGGDG